MHARIVRTAALAIGAATPLAAARNIDIIFSEIVGHPSSLVPAGAGVPAGAIFNGFDRPYRSADGTRWILAADTDLATTEDEIIVIGMGFTGATVVREGTAFGSPTAGELVGLIDRNMGIANDGRYAFATNTDGPTTNDEYIVVFDGANWVSAAREGDAVPGVPTEAFGTSLDAAGILADGTAVFRAPSTVGANPSTEDDFLLSGATIVAQSGLSVPGGQAGGATEAWENFDTDDFYVSADGATSIAQGDLTGDTTGDDVAVVNGMVVLQEDSLVPGSSLVSPILSLVEISMDPDGAWYVRGGNDDGQDWVVRNGDVVALRDEPIVTGSLETFSDAPFSATFFWMAGNAAGDYVIGGTTSNADVEADAVLVLNGTTVLARQGDPVDMNGNGLPDDDVFLDIFNNDDGFLGADGVLYFAAELQDGAGAALGQGFLAIDTTRFAPCIGDISPVPADGTVDFDDLLALLGSWGTCAGACETGCPGDLTADCNVGFDDLLVLLGAWGDCP